MLLGMRLEYLRIKFFMIENVSLFLKWEVNKIFIIKWNLYNV